VPSCVLGQVAVDEKPNEIPAVREPLKAFADLAGAVFTIDAVHTQHDTAQAILARRADYVMTVRAIRRSAQWRHFVVCQVSHAGGVIWRANC
jgi:predicted transposase YbfD/YdcC